MKRTRSPEDVFGSRLLGVLVSFPGGAEKAPRIFVLAEHFHVVVTFGRSE